MNNVGVIGHGFVGSAITYGMCLHTNVRVYDSDVSKSTHPIDEVVNESEFVFVCVPTPMTSLHEGRISLKILDAVMEEIYNINRRKDNIFIIKSTAVPGTTQKYINRYPDLNIVFNPEFLTERTAKLDFINPSRIVIGGASHLTERVKKLYRDRFKATKIICTDAASAEFIKYMNNCFFATKVSFINEMRQMAVTKDLNWNDIMIGFLSDGRIGNSHTDVPGHDGSLGFGGKCFPKDINAFIAYFEENNVDPKIMKAAWSKNIEVRTYHDWLKIKGAVQDKGE